MPSQMASGCCHLHLSETTFLEPQHLTHIICIIFALLLNTRSALPSERHIASITSPREDLEALATRLEWNARSKVGSFSALQVPLPAHDIHIIHSTFQWTFQSLRAESHCGPVLQTGPPIDGLPGSQQSDLCTGHLHCLLFIEEQNE